MADETDMSVAIQIHNDTLAGLIDATSKLTEFMVTFLADLDLLEARVALLEKEDSGE